MQTKGTTLTSQRLRKQNWNITARQDWGAGDFCYIVLDDVDGEAGKGFPIVMGSVGDNMNPAYTLFKVNYTLDGKKRDTIRATWKLYKTYAEASEARDTIFTKRNFVTL